MKVSICIPCYEQIKYLKSSMDSILIQTYKDYEVIISDDSKSELVENYIEQLKPLFNNNLFYHRNVPAKGTPGNWNCAMDYANGELIHLLHHDDYYSSPNSIEMMVIAAEEQPGVNVFVGEVISQNIATGEFKKLEVTESFLRKVKSNPKVVFFANLIGPPSIVFFRKTAKAYFDVKMKWLVDMEYYYRLFNANPNWSFMRKPFVTSINNAEHNVTNDCLLNPEVEIYEYLYFYNQHFTSFWPGFDIIKHFRMLINRYGIYSRNEMERYSKDERIPLFISILIYTSRYEYIFKNKQ